MLIKLIIITLVLDITYLTLTKGSYNSVVKSVQGSEIKLNYIAAALAYFFIVFIHYYYIEKKNATLRESGMLGLCAYGIFNATNLAIFDKWTWEIAILDTLWGATAFITSSYLYKII